VAILGPSQGAPTDFSWPCPRFRRAIRSAFHKIVVSTATNGPLHLSCHAWRNQNPYQCPPAHDRGWRAHRRRYFSRAWACLTPRCSRSPSLRKKEEEDEEEFEGLDEDDLPSHLTQVPA